jgi:demethylmenaquinone methyltransferase/2-methoxy-6-polyprenyl-1,4-benzoquinol methylase
MVISFSCCGLKCCISEQSTKDKYYIIKESSHSDRITRLYSRLAWLYDLFTDHEMDHHLEAIRLANIKGTEKILEVACGTGRATVELAKLLKKGQLNAIDLTEEMLKKAQKRAKKEGLLDKIEFSVADARNLPFSNEEFDLLYNAYMFDLIDMPDFSTILQEFKRVLKPGGKLILINMSKDKKNKTLYEFLYEKGLLGFASGGCRPVYLKPYLHETGFRNVQRFYRKNRSFFLLNLLTGTEIIIAKKPPCQ